jgi:hypothetical protein
MKSKDRDDGENFHIMWGYELGKNMRNPIAIDVRSKEFDCRSPVLGYLNYGNNCYYVSRIPDRKQKQGLNQESLITNDPRGLGGNYITTEYFKNMLIDKYPKQTKCFKDINAGEPDPHSGYDLEGIAFHRNFCYRKLAGNAIGMLYKERLIALYDNDIERFNLLQNKETSFMERLLEKNGVTL